MAVQYSAAVRNAQANALESTIGASAIMRIRSGAPPANCAAADTGTVLATINLPADWMTAAVAGLVQKNGTWQDTSADAAGTAGHYRIYDSGGTICGMQGTITATGGGGDMTVDNVNVAAGQSFTVNTFDVQRGNG